MGELIIFIIVLLFLIKGTIDDINHRMVKDRLTIGLWLILMVYSLISGNLFEAILGSVITFFTGYYFFRKKWWGGADLKIFVALGAYFGYPSITLPIFMVFMALCLIFSEMFYKWYLKRNNILWKLKARGNPGFVGIGLAYFIVAFVALF